SAKGTAIRFLQLLFNPKKDTDPAPTIKWRDYKDGGRRVNNVKALLLRPGNDCRSAPTSSAGIVPAVPRASRPRRGGRGRPPDSRRDGDATLRDAGLLAAWFIRGDGNPCRTRNLIAA